MKKVTKQNNVNYDFNGNVPMAFGILEDRVKQIAKGYYGYKLDDAEFMKFRISMTYNGISAEFIDKAIDAALLDIINPKKCNWHLVIPKYRDAMKRELRKGQEYMKNVTGKKSSTKGNK